MPGDEKKTKEVSQDNFQLSFKQLGENFDSIQVFGLIYGRPDYLTCFFNNDELSGPDAAATATNILKGVAKYDLYAKQPYKAACDIIREEVDIDDLLSAGCSIEDIYGKDAGNKVESFSFRKQASDISNTSRLKRYVAGPNIIRELEKSKIDDSKKLKTYKELLTLGKITQHQIKNMGEKGLDILRKIRCPISTLRELGFSDKQLIKGGYCADQLGGSRSDVRELPFGQVPITLLRDAGFTIHDQIALMNYLKKHEANNTLRFLFDAKFLKDNGEMTASQLCDIYGDSAQVLLGAGYTLRELKETKRFSSLRRLDEAFREVMGREISLQDFKDAGYDPGKLKRETTCSFKQLRDVGFTVQQFIDGFPDEHADGPLVEHLIEAGFTADEIIDGGYFTKKIAEKSQGIYNFYKLENFEDLTRAGFSPDNIIKAGYTKEILEKQCEGVYVWGVEAAALSILSLRGFSKENLKNAGFSDEELKRLEPPGINQHPADYHSAHEERTPRLTGSGPISVSAESAQDESDKRASSEPPDATQDASEIVSDRKSRGVE